MNGDRALCRSSSLPERMSKHSERRCAMAAKVKPIPDGYHTVTPMLNVENAAKQIEFIKQAFDAEEIYQLQDASGRVMHAEVKIGDSMVMVGGATNECKPMPATIVLYVEDADAWYARALRAG